MTNFLSPKEITEALVTVGEEKVNKSLLSTTILGILAGVYIGFGAQIATVVGTGTSEFLGFGITKLLMGGVFSVALMMIIIAGADLFTGNTLIVSAVMKKKVSTSQLIKNWIIIYGTNFIGALFVVFLVYIAGVWTMSESHLGMTALKIANDKVNLEFFPALARGILANWLVCLAVVMALSARDIVGKIFAIFFPIMTFVACGYEHSIANMYFIPMGILLKGETSLAGSSGLDLANLTWTNFFMANLVPVTIGNIIGGAVFVAMLYAMVYNMKK